MFGRLISNNQKKVNKKKNAKFFSCIMSNIFTQVTLQVLDAFFVSCFREQASVFMFVVFMSVSSDPNLIYPFGPEVSLLCVNTSTPLQVFKSSSEEKLSPHYLHLRRR